MSKTKESSGEQITHKSAPKTALEQVKEQLGDRLSAISKRPAAVNNGIDSVLLMAIEETKGFESPIEAAVNRSFQLCGMKAKV